MGRVRLILSAGQHEWLTRYRVLHRGWLQDNNDEITNNLLEHNSEKHYQKSLSTNADPYDDK